MQINSLADKLKGIEIHKPSLPTCLTSPKPEKNKVVGNPVRIPVNRQAALIISPVRDWTAQPLPPERLPTKEDKEISRLKAELKSERNHHATTRDELGAARCELKGAKRSIKNLRLEISELRAQLQNMESVIRQLEDLKL